MKLIITIVLLLLAVLAVTVRKTYFELPLHELKRRALKREQPAATLYRAVSYGGTLRILMWLYIGVFSAGGLILVARSLPAWLALVVIGLLIWLLFARLPKLPVTSFDRRLTIWVTPFIALKLKYLQPLLQRFSGGNAKRPRHTGLFEREDLLALIEQQQHQADSRLTPEELEIIKRALHFDEHTVADILTSKKVIKTVKPDDTIGPILIDELHKSGQDYAVVRESAKAPIVGTLAFRRLNLQSTGPVHSLMDDTVYYLHERDNLSQALRGFFVTNHPVFVVINSREEYLGLVSVESMLQQLLGHVPGDEFEEFSDPSAVAARHNP